MVSAAAAVVIAHNSAEELEACLSALRGACAEAIVVDNASCDDSATVARRHALNDEVRVIANADNRGFAGAANQGFEETRANCVLLLNPDAELVGPADLGPMVTACERYGLASGLLIGQDGKPQRGFFARRLPTPAALAFEALGLNRLWPGNPVNRRYRCLDLDPFREAFVEQPAGAFLMIRRDVWEKLNGFDESFFPVWFEDADFCKRAIDGGYRIRFVPACAARHEGGHSVLQVEAGTRATLWYGSLLRYAAKHFGALGFRAVCLAVTAGAAGRAVAGFRLSGWEKTVRTHGTIMRLAARSWLTGSVPSAGPPQADRKSVVRAVEQYFGSRK